MPTAEAREQGKNTQDSKKLVLSLDFARKVHECIQELPINTPIADLKFWRQHPGRIPTWTQLMRNSSHWEQKQLSALFYRILRSPGGKDINLGALTTEFDVDTLTLWSNSGGTGKTFVREAFQKF
ncbi:hypothetical protein HY383_03970 [Candidatus Daviesbacteria bacterium]|nr:hypothetical protein [Candidatus Daviesbacteria bacterium]